MLVMLHTRLHTPSARVATPQLDPMSSAIVGHLRSTPLAACSPLALQAKCLPPRPPGSSNPTFSANLALFRSSYVMPASSICGPRFSPPRCPT
ncbi:hypothetical protein IQ06DRAFT_11024 [Phaeosphaeriaceae sp. SRC1lsM3a]|nr:hypothetical protein IQ06DRAFT_11024 [Stagonospora sp. SRC1lsM3a]